ncbi:MAG: hypothetical protein WBA93_21235 [Microcoleaceae cyanobacterium]
MSHNTLRCYLLNNCLIIFIKIKPNRDLIDRDEEHNFYVPYLSLKQFLRIVNCQ